VAVKSQGSVANALGNKATKAELLIEFLRKLRRLPLPKEIGLIFENILEVRV
jgi:hypothetical protein